MAGRAMSRKGWMSTGKREMVSVSAASYSSYGRPSNNSSSRSSHRSSSYDRQVQTLDKQTLQLFVKRRPYINIPPPSNSKQLM